MFRNNYLLAVQELRPLIMRRIMQVIIMLSQAFMSVIVNNELSCVFCAVSTQYDTLLFKKKKKKRNTSGPMFTAASMAWLQMEQTQMTSDEYTKQLKSPAK